MLEQLVRAPAESRADLLAAPVAAVLAGWDGPGPVEVTEIDPAVADTAGFCARYGVLPEESANCVVVQAKRGGDQWYAACVVLATTRADINGQVRRHLGARKASFAPMEQAVAETGMDYGGITPIGLPEAWPVLIDERVAHAERVVVGSGLRRSKIILPGAALAALPKAEVLADLGI